jgi:hypothetical protein
VRHVQPDRPDLLIRRFAPLRLVAEKLKTSAVPADAFFDPDDFLFLSWALEDCPERVKVFKHVDTRKHLNLDRDGVPYRAGRDGTFVRHATLRDAIDALGLWELPWLRPELAPHRQGLAWEDRWLLYSELTGTGLHEAS